MAHHRSEADQKPIESLCEQTEQGKELSWKSYARLLPYIVLLAFIIILIFSLLTRIQKDQPPLLMYQDALSKGSISTAKELYFSSLLGNDALQKEAEQAMLHFLDKEVELYLTGLTNHAKITVIVDEIAQSGIFIPEARLIQVRRSINEAQEYRQLLWQIDSDLRQKNLTDAATLLKKASAYSFWIEDEQAKQYRSNWEAAVISEANLLLKEGSRSTSLVYLDAMVQNGPASEVLQASREKITDIPDVDFANTIISRAATLRASADLMQAATLLQDAVAYLDMMDGRNQSETGKSQTAKEATLSAVYSQENKRLLLQEAAVVREELLAIQKEKIQNLILRSAYPEAIRTYGDMMSLYPDEHGLQNLAEQIVRAYRVDALTWLQSDSPDRYLLESYFATVEMDGTAQRVLQLFPLSPRLAAVPSKPNDMETMSGYSALIRLNRLPLGSNSWQSDWVFSASDPKAADVYALITVLDGTEQLYEQKLAINTNTSFSFSYDGHETLQIYYSFYAENGRKLSLEELILYKLNLSVYGHFTNDGQLSTMRAYRAEQERIRAQTQLEVRAQYHPLTDQKISFRLSDGRYLSDTSSALPAISKDIGGQTIQKAILLGLDQLTLATCQINPDVVILRAYIAIPAAMVYEGEARLAICLDGRELYLSPPIHRGSGGANVSLFLDKADKLRHLELIWMNSGHQEDIQPLLLSIQVGTVEKKP